MPRKRMQPSSARQLAIELLASAGEPLRAKELAKRIVESGRCSGLKGKTPGATVSAMLAVGSKPGGPFARVDKGTYVLAEQASPPPKRTSQAKTRPTRIPASKTRKRAKPSSKTAH